MQDKKNDMQKQYANSYLKLKKPTATQWKKLGKSKHFYTLLNLTAPSGAFKPKGNNMNTFLNLVNAIPTPAKVAILVALYLIASTMEYNDCINMGAC